jgi:hypothetical protein
VFLKAERLPTLASCFSLAFTVNSSINTNHTNSDIVHL